MELSERIRFMRMFKGWSQEEMASKLHMALSGYAKIERGETDVPFSRLQQIAKTFEIELSQLIGMNEKNVFNIAGNSHDIHDSTSFNTSFNVYPCEALKSQHENEKLRLLLEQKEKEIEYLKQQNADLREMLLLLKK